LFLYTVLFTNMRFFHELGARKDTAVYNAMIAALQLAAQRLLLEESQALAQGADRGNDRGNATSRGLFEKAQQVYAEGLADGQLQHFAYDLNSFAIDSSSELRRSGVGLSPEDTHYTQYSSSIGNPVSEMSTATATASDSLESLDVSKKDGTHADDASSESWVLGSEDLRISQEDSVTADLFKENSAMDGNLGSDFVIDSKGGPALHSSLTVHSTLPLASSTSPISRNFPAIKPVRVSGVPRVLDLHKCPLLVAKAAIDFEMKQIYEMCTASDAEMIGDSGDERITSGRGTGNSFSGDRSMDRDGEHIGGSATGESRGGALVAIAATPVTLASPRRVSSRARIRSLKRSLDTAASISDTDSLSISTVAASAVPPPSPAGGDMHTSLPVHTGSGPGSDPGSLHRRGRSCPYDLHIITGRGWHINSSGTRGVLRLQIKEYFLDNYGISAEKIMGNDGCIIITRASVDSWVDKMQSL
jgi:hypothetical protein